MQRQPSLSDTVNGGRHWIENVSDAVLSINPQNPDFLPFTVGGGSENALFPYVSQIKSETITYVRLGNGQRLSSDDILLEIQGRKIAGLTSYDAQRWLVLCCQRGGPLTIKFIKSGLLTKDLRQYLGMRFPKASVDHDLQSTIRDNVYLKTVPCTTRLPKNGEIDGVDYRFVSREEFDALERHGELLESGIFEGNYYGTPKPPKLEENELDHQNSSNPVIVTDNKNTTESVAERRRRNRTDLGEMAPLFAANSDLINPPTTSYHHHQQHNNYQNPSTSSSIVAPVTSTADVALNGYPLHSVNNGNNNNNHSNHHQQQQQHDEDDGLGPMPPSWEIAYTETGEKYFIDHNTGTTHWNDPRLGFSEHRPSVSSSGSDLPNGWEKVEDPHYGVYYVDHVNKRTQYEKPSHLTNGYGGVTNSTSSMPAAVSANAAAPRRVNSVPDFAARKLRLQSPHKGYFTRNPSELRGELISTRLIKSAKGLGFTLVGNDGSSGDEELLQIKNIIAGGPAFRDGRLRTGDVLVYVNDACVLGYTQSDIIRLFQSVSVGSPVALQVCRGYPLLFDPSDPSNDFVTQDAYSVSESDASTAGMSDLNLRPDTVTAHIVKGDMGFGFTITDCAEGQKVKSIIDKQRCQNLTEGDILIEINGRNIRKMNHADIVEVFGDCPVGQTAIIVCQRKNTGTLKRSQTEGNGYPTRPPAVPAKPISRPVRNAVDGRPHSYHPGYNNGQPNTFDSRGYKPPTHAGDINSGNYAFVGGAPNAATAVYPAVKPRSKTVGPAPPRPTKANGFLPEHYQRQMSSTIPNRPLVARNSGPHYAADGVPIYENLPGANNESTAVRSSTNESLNGGVDRSSVSPTSRRNRSKSPAARPKTPLSNSFFASATPNYVPASVYTSAAAGRYRPTHQEPSTISGPPTSGYSSGDYEQLRSGRPPPVGGAGAAAAAAASASSLPYGKTYYPMTTSVAGGGIEPSTRFQYITANLMRRADGFGFRIVGGVEEGTQTSVGHVVPGGAADQDDRIKMGDEIVEIDSQPTLGVSHEKAVGLLRNAGRNGHVKLVVRREINELPRSVSMPIPRPIRPYPYDVTIPRRENEGFGFIIVASAKKRRGSIVVEIIPGGAASRCGQLKVGDCIVAVNGIDILQMDHSQIVNLIKDSGLNVTLTVGHYEDPNSNSAHNPTYPFSNVGQPNESSAALQTPKQRLSLVSLLDPLSELAGYHDIEVSEPPSPSADDGLLPNLGPAFRELSNLISSRCAVRTDEPALSAAHEEYFAVELNRGAKGFGFSIRGGREFSNMDLFVLRIAEGGPAFLDGRLQIGDQLIDINGVSTTGMSHADAIELIKREPTVRLLVRRHPNPPVDGSTVSTSPSLESPYGRLNGMPTAPIASGENVESLGWSRNR